jgi:predicted PurR-regulated permease PerM
LSAKRLTMAYVTQDPEFGHPGRRLAPGPFLAGAFAAAGVLVTVVIALGVRRAATIITVIVVAGFIAIGLDRPITAMMRKGLRRVTAFGIVVLAGAIVAFLIIALLVPPLAHEFGAFFQAVPGYVDRLMAKSAASDLDTQTDTAAQISRAVSSHKVAELAGGILTGVGTIAGALFYGLTTMMLTMLILWRLPSLRDGAYRLVVASRRDRVRSLVEEMLNKVGSYLVGAVSVAFCAGVGAFLWCYFTGVPYPFVMAVLVGIFDMIPQVGATIGSAIVTLVAWTDSLGLAVATIAFFCVYQAIENWLVYPRVMSHAVKISNLAAIVAALLGGALFGVIGVLLAVPVYASVQLVVREVFLPRQNAR